MKHSASWEANSRSAIHDIAQLLWYPKVYYSVQKGPPVDPVLSQINPVHTFTFLIELTKKFPEFYG